MGKTRPPGCEEAPVGSIPLGWGGMNTAISGELGVGVKEVTKAYEDFDFSDTNRQSDS